MSKKLTSIIYRYDDGSVEYVDDVTQVSIFSISSSWINKIIDWFRRDR